MISSMLFAVVALSVNCMTAAIACAVASKYSLEMRLIRPLCVTAFGGELLCQTVIANRRSDNISAMIEILAIAAVTVSALTDAQTGYVFDAISLTSLAGILAFSAANHTFAPALIGAGAAGGALTLLHAVTLGRGLGLGDAKLACCMGPALGPSDGLASLGIAFVLGGAYAGFLLVSRRGRRSDAVPFAPYLAFATVLMSLYRSIA